MRPSSALIQPARGGGRNAVRQAVPRRRNASAGPSMAVNVGQLAPPHLSRLLHATSSAYKPRSTVNQAYRQPDSGHVYRMQAHLSGDLAGTYVPDASHILAEWRLLEREALQSLKGKERDTSGVELEAQSAERQFFTPRFPRSVPEPVQAAADERLGAGPAVAPDTIPLPFTDAREQHTESLWIASVDPLLMSKAMTSTVAEVRGGQLDLNTLADKALSTIQGSEDNVETKNSRREQLRFMILSHWLAVIRSAMDGLATKQERVQLLLLHITDSLYRSSLQDSVYHHSRSLALKAIQRAALHRLCASLLEISEAKTVPYPAVRAAALHLVSLVARDKRLKGAQTRFIARKIVRVFDMQSRQQASSPKLFLSAWTEISTTLTTLLRRQVILPQAQRNSGGTAKSQEATVARFLNACLVEAQKAKWTYAASKVASSLVRDSFVSISRQVIKIETARTLTADRDDEVKIALGSLQPELTTFVRKLVQLDEPTAARELYTATPAVYHTFESACYLMRSWSSVPLRMKLLEPADEVEGIRRRSGFSETLLATAIKHIQWENEAKATEQLRLLASCRFSSHLQRRDVHALIDDLDELARHWPESHILSRTGVLERLDERAQLAAVRTFAKCDRLGHAMQVALRLAKLSLANQSAKTFPVRLANALFSASIPNRSTTIIGSPPRLQSLLKPGLRRPAVAISQRVMPVSKSRQTIRGLNVLREFCARTETQLDRKTSILILRRLGLCRGVRISNDVLVSLADRMEWHLDGRTAADVIEEVLLIIGARNSKQETIQMMRPEQRQRLDALLDVIHHHSRNQH